MIIGYDPVGIAEVMGLAFNPDTPETARFGFREEGPRAFANGVASAFATEGQILESSSPLAIERAIEEGLPRQVLRNVAERIGGGDKMKVAALEWSIVPKTTLERRQTRLSPQESERTERMARLFVHARRALGSEEEARVFVTAPHPELEGRSPLEAARTDLGTRRVEQILNALEYGLVL